MLCRTTRTTWAWVKETGPDGSRLRQGLEHEAWLCPGCPVLGSRHPGPGKVPLSLVCCAFYFAADRNSCAWLSLLPVFTFPLAPHHIHRRGAKPAVPVLLLPPSWPSTSLHLPHSQPLVSGRQEGSHWPVLLSRSYSAPYPALEAHFGLGCLGDWESGGDPTLVLQTKDPKTPEDWSPSQPLIARTDPQVLLLWLWYIRPTRHWPLLWSLWLAA